MIAGEQVFKLRSCSVCFS